MGFCTLIDRPDFRDIPCGRNGLGNCLPRGICSEPTPTCEEDDEGNLYCYGDDYDSDCGVLLCRPEYCQVQALGQLPCDSVFDGENFSPRGVCVGTSCAIGKCNPSAVALGQPICGLEPEDPCMEWRYAFSFIFPCLRHEALGAYC